MPDEKATVSSLGSLENVLSELHRIFDGEGMWWRGHSNAEWTLKPFGFRDRLLGAPYNPRALIGNFKMRAPGRLGHRPLPSSDLEWLFLAQHYGLPTQLLDWTENPLVALFFAVSQPSDAESDGCLWALSPTKLNVEHANPTAPGSAQRGLINLDEPPVRAIVMKAIGIKDEPIRKRLFPEVPPESGLPKLPKVIALASVEIDERIVAQSGRFTLHACSEAVESLSGSEKFLRKFIIPAHEKQRLRGLLELMGIRLWNLFPDLQSLASELKKNDFIQS